MACYQPAIYVVKLSPSFGTQLILPLTENRKRLNHYYLRHFAVLTLETDPDHLLFQSKIQP